METLLVVSATGLKLEWWLVGTWQDFYTQKCGRYARLHKRALSATETRRKKEQQKRNKTKSCKQPTAKRNQRVYVLPPPSLSASFSSVLCAQSALATHPKYRSTWAICSFNHDRFPSAVGAVAATVAAAAPRMQSCAREPATQPVAHRTHPPHRCMGMCTHAGRKKRNTKTETHRSRPFTKFPLRFSLASYPSIKDLYIIIFFLSFLSLLHRYSIQLNFISNWCYYY